MISSYQVPNYLMVFNILISFMFLLLETLQLETWTLVKPVHQTYLLGFTSISILRLCHLVKMVSPLQRLCFLAIVKQAESGLAKADFWITMMKETKRQKIQYHSSTSTGKLYLFLSLPTGCRPFIPISVQGHSFDEVWGDNLCRVWRTRRIGGSIVSSLSGESWWPRKIVSGPEWSRFIHLNGWMKEKRNRASGMSRQNMTNKGRAKK